MFFRGSRYETVPSAELMTEGGRLIRYKRVRFISEAPAGLTHTVAQGDRLDLISHNFYDDPERFWLIADANTAMRPRDLVAETGRLLLIPLQAR